MFDCRENLATGAHGHLLLRGAVGAMSSAGVALDNEAVGTVAIGAQPDEMFLD